jgi:aminoglycoside phosphotransferase (APT) family kinase protein
MEMVEGRIFWHVTLPDIGHDERAACFDAMNVTLAAPHARPRCNRAMARPSNYFERQIARWQRQYLEGAQAGRDPYLDRLIDWLPVNIPPGNETSILHGNFRVDNMIFHPKETRILAVLEWELSTLDHPLADFAYHSMMCRMPPRIVAELAGADIQALNIQPSRNMSRLTAADRAAMRCWAMTSTSPSTSSERGDLSRHPGSRAPGRCLFGSSERASSNPSRTH